MLAVAFPHDQVQVLAYNRVVRDLAGMSADEFLAATADRFTVTAGSAEPAARGQISMYLTGRWHTLVPGSRLTRTMRSRRWT